MCITGFCINLLCCGKDTWLQKTLHKRREARKQLVAADDASTSTV
jgi:hypothetical protein